MNAQLSPDQPLSTVATISPAAAALLDFQEFCRLMVELAEGRLQVCPEDQSQAARVQNFRKVKENR